MKLFYTAIVFLFFFETYGQTLINDEDKISIHKPFLCNLFIGIDNFISVTNQNKNTSFTIKTAMSKVAKKGKNQFSLSTSRKKAFFDTLFIYKNNKDSTLVYQEKLLWSSVPPPQAAIGNIRNCNISKKLLSLYKGIHVDYFDYFPLQNKTLNFPVRGFKMSFISKEIKKELISKSNFFTKDQLKAISISNIGDKLIIEDIFVLLPCGNTIKISPLIYYISE